MNVADIVILAVLALSALLGLLHGFVSELLSLLCWVAAFWVAWAFGPQVAAFYGTWWHEPAGCLIAGYVTCFLGVLIVGALLGWALRGLMKRGGLGGGDRFLGLLFGLARGVLLVTFVVLMLGFTKVPRDAAWWRQSMLLPAFEQGAGWLAQELPPDVTRYLETGGKALPALAQAPISELQQAARKAARPASAASVAPAVSVVPPAAGTSGRASGHDQSHG